jgi:hypothetical protein
MTRPRTIGSVLVFCFLFAGPAVAEIINLSVSGEISGSEEVIS